MSKIEGFKNIEDYTGLNIIINELNNIYQEWLNVFPFDLWCFKHLKSEFQRSLPIIKNNQAIWDKERNEITIDLYSRKSFENYLLDLTNNILASINTLTLVDENIIDNADKHKLDIIIQQRRTKLHSQKRFARISKPEYLSFIMEWFDDEKIFIEEITPYLEENKDIYQEKKITAKWYALLHIFKINALLEEAFPLNDNDQFDYKLIKKFAEDNYPLKNGQGFYRAFKEFYSEKEDAIKKSFGKDYKQTLIEITTDPLLIAYIERLH